MIKDSRIPFGERVKCSPNENNQLKPLKLQNNLSSDPNFAKIWHFAISESEIPKFEFAGWLVCY